jgi:hypothetical protein
MKKLKALLKWFFEPKEQEDYYDDNQPWWNGQI